MKGKMPKGKMPMKDKVPPEGMPMMKGKMPMMPDMPPKERMPKAKKKKY